MFESVCLISLYYHSMCFTFCFLNIQFIDKFPKQGVVWCESIDRSFFGFDICKFYFKVNILFFEFYIYGEAL